MRLTRIAPKKQTLPVQWHRCGGMPAMLNIQPTAHPPNALRACSLPSIQALYVSQSGATSASSCGRSSTGEGPLCGTWLTWLHSGHMRLMTCGPQAAGQAAGSAAHWDSMSSARSQRWHASCYKCIC